MPLREFRIGEIGEELYPRWIAQLAARLDDPALDRSVVVRDELARLYLGRDVDFDRELGSATTPAATRTLLATLDPRLQIRQRPLCHRGAPLCAARATALAVCCVR